MTDVLVAPAVDARPHVLYRMLDEAGDLLYVGITLRPTDRFHAHQNKKPWWSQVHTIQLEHFDDRVSVLQAEQAAIKAERPLHNLVHNNAFAVAENPLLAQLREAASRRDEAKLLVERESIVCADHGHLQKDIAEAAGRTREWVRQLVLKHRGVDESA